MKKIIITLLAILVLLTGCGTTTNEISMITTQYEYDNSNNIIISSFEVIYDDGTVETYNKYNTTNIEEKYNEIQEIYYDELY